MFKYRYLLLILSLGLMFACQQENVDELLKEARHKMKSGAFQEAVSLLDVALETDADNTEALNMRGVARVNLEEYSKALTDFDKAISIDQTSYKYYFNRGNVKRTLNKPHDAIADYTQALKLDSTQHQIWLNRALCYTASDELLKALNDFAGAMRHGGRTDAKATFYHGKLFMVLESYESAVEAFENCLSVDNENAEAHYMLGLAKLGAEMPKEEACKHFEKSSTLGYDEANHAIEDHCK